MDLVQLEDELNEATSRADMLVAEWQKEEFDRRWNLAIWIGGIGLALLASIALFIQIRSYKRVKLLNRDLASRNELISVQIEKLDEQTRTLSESQKLLQKSNADKDKLLALISHDLRSPLAQTKSIADLVVSGSVGKDEVVSFFEKVSETANKSLENLTEVLLWARGQMSEGVESSKREAVNAKVAIDNAIRINQELFDSKGLVIRLDVPKE